MLLFTECFETLPARVVALGNHVARRVLVTQGIRSDLMKRSGLDVINMTQTQGNASLYLSVLRHGMR